MKTPLYETSSGALQALLFTRAFFSFDLYSFTPALGSVMRFTTADRDVVVNGAVWTSGSALFDLSKQAAKAHWKAGTDVDTWTVHLAPRPTDTINGTPWLSALRMGLLDKAAVQIDRAYFSNDVLASAGGQLRLAPTGVITVFGGQVAEVDISTVKASLTINSWMDILNLSVPRNVYQAACRHTLYDRGCGLTKSNYQVNATVTAASSNASLSVSVGSPPGTLSFTLGRIQLTSGPNTGFSRTIRSFAGGTVQLIAPFPAPVTAGTSALMVPGCLKTMAACDVYGNLPRFGGMPYIPAQETAV